MNIWMPFPFLRFVLWLLAGLVAGYYCAASPAICGILLLLAVCCYGLLFFSRTHLPASRTLLGLAACLILFLLGFGRMLQQKAILQTTAIPADTTYWLLEANAAGVPTAKTMKVQTRILSFKQENGWEKARGGLIVYLDKKQLQEVPAYGDRFVLRAALQEIPKALNPNAFDYKGFMAEQGIHYQVFAKSSDLAFVSHRPDRLLALARQVQQWGSRQFAAYIPGSRESTIATALLLGNRTALEEDTKQAYATAGVMHILAVSGLHVGFIFLLLKMLFRPWRRTVTGKWAGFFCTIILLWAYAFITGLSPSVLRAASMFSLLSVAFLLKRKSGIYNTLAVAAFCLLLYNPFFIFSVGFQLSFLALLGIVYLQPRLAALYTGKKRLYRRIFDLMAVSLAAQLATFPLGLYYFGQFPTYFLFTNLLVVPAASIIVFLGLLLLLSSLFSSSLATLSGWLLDQLIGLINSLVFFTDSLPYSRLNSTLEKPELALLMGFLFVLMVLLSYRRMLWVSLAFVVGMGFVGSLFYTLYRQKQKQQLIAYQVPGYSALHFVEGRKEYLYAPEALPDRQLQYQLQPNRLAMGLMSLGSRAPGKAFEPPSRQQGPFRLLVWRGKTIAIVTEKLLPDCRQQKAVKVDLLILSNNLVAGLDELSCYFSPGRIIIDGSNYFWIQEKLARQAEQLKQPYHLTARSGAFVLDVKD